MRLTLSSDFRVLLAAVFVLSMCAPTPAQEPQIDALADQMAAALSHAKLKSVMVFDFVGPDETDALGQKVAAGFRTALAKSAYGLQVEGRSRLIELLQENELVPANLHTYATEQWLVGQTDLDAWISGTLSNGIGGLKVTVDARCNLKSCDRFYEFQTSTPLTDDLKKLVGENKNEEDEFASLPRAEKNGYSSVSCVYCPQAQFSKEALVRKLVGTVILDLTITEDGHPKDIRVKVGLPYGLTRQAIEAIKEWRFKPATAPDGEPAAIRTTVEVTFHLY
jgi:TonB family protein